MEQADQFEPSLRRLASLSKIDYATLSHEARQLLLTRRDEFTFLQRTHHLIDNLWEVLDSHNIPGPQTESNSPTTHGGRIWNPTWLSPTVS